MRALLISTLLLASAGVSAEEAAKPAATQSTTEGSSDNERVIAAMEKAAAAAQSAAESAARAAAAAERAAGPAKAEGPATAGPAPAPGAGAAAGAKWTNNIGFGLISLTGNSRSITATTTVAAERKSEDWIFALKGAAAYGESSPPVAAGVAETSSVIAALAGATLRGDRRFTERYSAYLLAGADTDRVKSVARRLTGEAGLSILWIDEKEGNFLKRSLKTDLAMRHQEEKRFQFYPVRLEVADVKLTAPRVAASFRYALSKEVVFLQDLEVLPNVVGESRVLANSLSKLSSRLSASVALTLGFSVAYDSKPAAGKEDTDTTLSAGLEVAL